MNAVARLAAFGFVIATVGGLWLRVSRRRARDTPANQGQWWPRFTGASAGAGASASGAAVAASPAASLMGAGSASRPCSALQRLLQTCLNSTLACN